MCGISDFNPHWLSRSLRPCWRFETPSAKGPSAISWPQTHHDGGVGRAGSGCSGSGGTEQHGTLSKALGHSWERTCGGCLCLRSYTWYLALGASVLRRVLLAGSLSVGHLVSWPASRQLAINCYQSKCNSWPKRIINQKTKSVCARKFVKKCQEVNEEKLKISKINQVWQERDLQREKAKESTNTETYNLKSKFLVTRLKVQKMWPSQSINWFFFLSASSWCGKL